METTEEIVKELDDRLLLAESKIEIIESSREITTEAFNTIAGHIKSSTEVAQDTLDHFELLDIKLSNKDKEIEILRSKIRTLEMELKSIAVKLGLN